MEVTIHIAAPELSVAINNLAAALQAGQTISKAAAPKAAKQAPVPAVVETAPPATATVTPVTPPAEVTLEQVRAAIVAKGKDKMPAAKKIIEGFGSPNLSAIAADKYPAILEQVEAL